MAKRYTQEIHQAALKRHFIGKQTAAQIGREMKIPRQTIGAWITTAKVGLKGSEWTPRRIRELCRKVKRLEDIIAVLKAVECTAHSPAQEKLGELERLYGRFSNHVLCDALDVPRGTFLNHIRRNKREANSYRERRELLKERISSIHDAAHQRFGAGKIARNGVPLQKRHGTHLRDNRPFLPEGGRVQVLVLEQHTSPQNDVPSGIRLPTSR